MDQTIAYTVKLEQCRRAAFPSAIRNTLTAAAKDVKTDTMIVESGRAFHKRKPTFFNATSRFEGARGFDVRNMKAIVGFVAPGSIKESGHATKDLEQQEHGGNIDKRAFIATDKGRTGAGNVRDALTMRKIKPFIVDAKKEFGKNDQERFIRAAMKAGYPDGYVIGTGKNGKGNRMLLKIISIHRATKGEKIGVRAGSMVVKTQAIYSVHAQRKAHVHATHFMEKAAKTSAGRMPAMFIANAEFQINKVMKK